MKSFQKKLCYLDWSGIKVANKINLNTGSRQTMEKKPSGLHENETNTSCVALIIIDMINDLEFPGATDMFNAAVRAAENIALLKERARQEKLPVIYANDNFGRWRSNFVDITQYCLQSDVRGRPLVEILKPVSDDYFVLKPRHSAFYATPLE